MNEQFSLKYRPQKFSEVFGHEKTIKDLLENSKKNIFPKVILFSGITGTGKCITKNSLLLTENGFKYITNFSQNKEGTFPLKIKTSSKDGLIETSNFFEEKTNKTIYIKTKFGFEIEGTPEHKLYIIDNSDFSNEDIIKQTNKKIVYLPQYKNNGIAKALNCGVDLAKMHGYKWLLTMDQDSSFSESMSEKYFNCFDNIDNIKDTIIIAPFYKKYNTVVSSSLNITYKYIEPLTVITSGNLINLDLVGKIDGFNEKLFIDEVDFDFCLRARLQKFRIIQFTDIHLNHKLGEALTIKKNSGIFTGILQMEIFLQLNPYS